MQQDKIVLSGMRPTGKLHLGNFHGALKNWVALQDKYNCYFFVADLHSLTTAYEHTENLAENSRNMLIDWLTAGLDPEKCTIFIQSDVPEVSELNTLLGMITPDFEVITSQVDERAITADTPAGGGTGKAEVRTLSGASLNQPYLLEGSLPAEPGQIAVTRKYLEDSGKALGDTLTLIPQEKEEETPAAQEDGEWEITVEDTGAAEPALARTEFTITGLVLDPMDVNSGGTASAFRVSSNTDYTFFVLAEDIDTLHFPFQSFRGSYLVSCVGKFPVQFFIVFFLIFQTAHQPSADS